jgi:hypothetical protein
MQFRSAKFELHKRIASREFAVGRIASLVWLVVSTAQVASMAGWLRFVSTPLLTSAWEDGTASFDLYFGFRTRNGWILAVPLLVAVLVAEKGIRRLRRSDFVTIGLGIWILGASIANLAPNRLICHESTAEFWIGPGPGLSSTLLVVLRALCSVALFATLVARGSELDRGRWLPLGPLALVAASMGWRALQRVLKQGDGVATYSSRTYWMPVMVLGFGTLVLTAGIARGNWSKSMLVGVSALGCIGFVALF